jgi:hypothetical protein
VGEVDIWDVTDSSNPVLLYEDVNFGDVGDYVEIPAGSYTLGFDVDNDEVPDLEFETGELPEGSIINIYAVNKAAVIFLIAQLQDGSTLRINPN